MITAMMTAKKLDEIAGDLEYLQRQIDREWRMRHESKLKEAIAASKKEVLGALSIAEDAIETVHATLNSSRGK
jgi:hypothetical protein